MQYKPQSNKPISTTGLNIERVKRPSSLIKPVNEQASTSSPLTIQTKNATNYNRFRQPEKTAQNHLVQPQSSLNNDNEEQFPPPPPIPHQQQPHQHAHQFGNVINRPVMLQDYQEPNSIRSSIQSKSNLFYNVEDEFKKKKNPLEESYCIVKELVMTERTFKKDLDLLTQTFRQFAVTNNFDLSELMLFDQLLYPQVLEPISEFHAQFLKDLELRLFYW